MLALTALSSDVGAFGRVLLVEQLSEGGAALHPGAAADGNDQRLARNDASGRGVGVVAPSLAIVAAWLVVSFTLALRLFRWR